MSFITRSIMGFSLTILTFGIITLSLYEWRSVGGEDDNSRASARQSGNNARVYTVNVDEIKLQNLSPELNGFGKIIAAQSLDLRVSTGGEIIALIDGFANGLSVKKGDVIARIDPVTLETALAFAKADLKDAKTELNDAIFARNIAESEVEAAERQFELREAALERQKSLREKGVGTDTTLEQAELASSSSEQAFLAKRQAFASAKTRVGRAESTIARSELSVKDAEYRLAQTVIRAPFDGQLSNVNAALGKRTNANETLGQLLDPSKLEVQITISIEEFSRFGDAILGRDVKVKLTATDAPIMAKIVRVDPSVTTGETGRRIYARILKAEENLRPGDFVDVNISEPELKNIISLPSTAFGPQGDILLVGPNNKLELQNVTLLRRSGNKAIVTAQGIEGRFVVVERTPQLGKGITVKPNPIGDREFKEVEMVKLTDEQQEKFKNMLANNKRMPSNVRQNLIAQIEAGELRQDTFERLSKRMEGGGRNRAQNENKDESQETDKNNNASQNEERG